MTNNLSKIKKKNDLQVICEKKKIHLWQSDLDLVISPVFIKNLIVMKYFRKYFFCLLN